MFAPRQHRVDDELETSASETLFICLLLKFSGSILGLNTVFPSMAYSLTVITDR